jgi:hypothetical protein
MQIALYLCDGFYFDSVSTFLTRRPWYLWYQYERLVMLAVRSDDTRSRDRRRRVIAEATAHRRRRRQNVV